VHEKADKNLNVQERLRMLIPEISHLHEPIQVDDLSKSQPMRYIPHTMVGNVKNILRPKYS
jgi:hypothetical protein